MADMVSSSSPSVFFGSSSLQRNANWLLSSCEYTSGLKLWPADTSVFSLNQTHDSSGRSFSFKTATSVDPAHATDMEESCATHPILLPDGLNPTQWTQPPPPLLYSAIRAPNGIFLPQGVASGFDSISLMYVENTLDLKSVLEAASRTLFGCQSTESTVERIGFLMCLLTHQLFSLSK